MKGTKCARASSSIEAMPRCPPVNGCKRDFIINFRNSLADNTTQLMPDCNGKHLPWFDKKSVCNLFREEFSMVDAAANPIPPPSASYFYRTWSQHVQSVKVRRHHRFTKCHECELLRSELNKCGTNEQRAKPILMRQRLHHDFIGRERREYARKIQQAERNPSLICSMVVDGADQSAFGLPHFTFDTKSSPGHKLKMKLVGVLEHGPTKMLNLFLLTEEFQTGGNHVIESIHRVIQQKYESGLFPKTLYVQLDNCTRENKNRFVLAYLEMMVSKGVFEEVYASFLPIGHTHSAIDKCFSRTSHRLRLNDAITMDDLLSELRESFSPTPHVSRMLHVANFSELCTQQKCLAKVPAFSHFRFFKFCRASGPPRSEFEWYSTLCLVRIGCSDNWSNLSENNSGFLGRTPGIRLTPPTVLEAPDNLAEVNKCLDSNEARIGDTTKLASLMHLRDRVYTSRSENFHWDMEQAVEMNGKYRIPQSFDTDGYSSSGDCKSGMLHYKLDYELYEFIAVKTDDKNSPFWIAEVISIIRDGFDSTARALKVHWYEASGKERDAFYAT